MGYICVYRRNKPSCCSVGEHSKGLYITHPSARNLQAFLISRLRPNITRGLLRCSTHKKSDLLIKW